MIPSRSFTPGAVVIYCGTCADLFGWRIYDPCTFADQFCSVCKTQSRTLYQGRWGRNEMWSMTMTPPSNNIAKTTQKAKRISAKAKNEKEECVYCGECATRYGWPVSSQTRAERCGICERETDGLLKFYKGVWINSEMRPFKARPLTEPVMTDARQRVQERMRRFGSPTSG